MHSIHDIVSWINQQVKEMFPDAKTYGIAHTAKRGEEIVQMEGGNYIGIDDINVLQSYHKQNSLRTTIVPRSGFGDNENYQLNTYEHSLIVFFNYKKCGFTVDELYTFIQSKITGSLKREGYRKVVISVSSAILNDSTVWTQEYGTAAFRLKDDQRLISIGYSVAFTLDKNCITIPNCKN